MKRLSEKAVTLVAKSLKALISAYQATKFLRQPTCRFYPSCSHYAYQAIDRHGALLGVMLSAARMSKCHPFHPGGVDEVPESVTFEWIGAGPLVGKFKRLTREL